MGKRGVGEWKGRGGEWSHLQVVKRGVGEWGDRGSGRVEGVGGESLGVGRVGCVGWG